MQVVILAGGLGTRLKPITEKTPKVMIPIHGKPFLEHQLVYLKKAGFKKFLLLVSYLGEQIENYFKKGMKWGVTIDYSYEEQPMGTGGALKRAGSLLDKTFLLLNGDSFCPINFSHFLSQAIKITEGGMIVVYDNHEKIDKNNMRVEENGFIAAYDKKKVLEGLNGVDGGIAFFHRSILDLILNGKKISLEEEIYPLLIEKKLLRAYFTNIRYYDMGTFERLETVRKLLK